MRSKAEDWLRGNLEKMDFSDFTVVSEASGESNDNLILDTDAGKRVLKVSKDISTDKLENEARCLSFLDKNSVSKVPELVFFKSDTVIGDVLIQTYVGEEEVNPEDLKGEELRRLAEAISEHQLPVEDYNEHFDEDIKPHVEVREFFREDFEKWGKKPYKEYLRLVENPDERVRKVYQKHREMIESIGSGLELKQSFVHGDLAANLRASGEELYIIDWELGRAGAKEIELLYLFEHSEMPEEKREKIIEHYRRKSGLSDGFEEARKLYPRSLAFNDLMWAAKRKEKAKKQEDEDAERYEEMFRRRLNRVQDFYN